MSIADIERIARVLEAMEQYELLLSDLYRHCADLWADDQALWDNLALAEIQHAANIKKMQEIIAKKGGGFTAGRPFNLIALNTASGGIKENIRRLEQGEIPREKALIMARDIEQSILEANYAEIVKTTDLEYNALMKSVLSQTYGHKKMIQEKIAGLKATA
jgi:hypothetical protein